MKATLYFCLLLLNTRSAFGQLRTFSWGEQCISTGTYDARKVTETQLKGLYTLVTYSVRFDTPYLAWSPEQIDTLSIAKLDAEFAKKLAELQRLKIIPNSFWRECQKKLITELEKWHEVCQVSIRSYKEPKLLRTICGDTCRYAEAIINGGDSSYQVWKTMAEEHCRTNSDPQKCVEWMYTEKYNGLQRTEYAKIELMLFGWMNHCALRARPKPPTFEEMHKQFTALFTNIKTEPCED